MDVNQEKLFSGQIPTRIVIGLVRNDAFNGLTTRNPFNFQNFRLRKVMHWIERTFLAVTRCMCETRPEVCPAAGRPGDHDCLCGVPERNRDRQKSQRHLRLCSMNTDQLDRTIRLYAKRFDGVFSSDCLPTKPRLMVCNTDPSDESGEHWIAIYVDDGGHYGEYFDSLDVHPLVHSNVT